MPQLRNMQPSKFCFGEKLLLDDFLGVASDHQLLVGSDDQSADLCAPSGDLADVADRMLVLVGVDADAQPIHVVADLCTSKIRLIMLNAQKRGRGCVFWLTNQKKNGTIGESSVRGRLLIQAPGKLTISAMVPKNQRYGYNPSVGKN